MVDSTPRGINGSVDSNSIITEDEPVVGEPLLPTCGKCLLVQDKPTKFCRHCGAEVSRICKACKAPNNLSAKSCVSCQ